MTYNNLFGKKLKELRGDMSLREFSDLIGISHTYLSSLEKGVSPRTGKPVNITADTVITISKNLNIDSSELFNLMIKDSSQKDHFDENEITYMEEIPSATFLKPEESDNKYGDHNKNLEYFSDKPELLELYKDIHESENLQLLFDTARNLTPEELEAVLNVINMIHKGE
ncbi:helix-turn-helix domain-containing protein [Erysipelothrix urinaevulpis]|uniref:helix-turn-helix domain-containing protein n=1 Tax=Erysipelothrix urinaevulpis TaxID=2683717 RepID=UPI001357A0AF|nr:helix-turn-helix transcriptional regulator [Erysipelothrix urinaevulpis]